MREALRDPRYLRMAGGTIAVIGGIYATLLAVIGLYGGGLGAFGDTWTRAGLSLTTSLVCGILVIFLGALAINARGPFPGIMVVVCSILGAIFGGLFVTVFMILPLIGGALAAAAAQRETPIDTTATASPRRRAR